MKLNMFTNINGSTRIFEREVEYKKNGRKATFTAYSVTVGKKDDDGKYINAYLDVFLSKNAQRVLDGLMPDNNGSYLVNVTGWLTVRESKRKGEPNRVALFVNELEEVEE